MKNILIVDDDSDLLKLYKRAFLNAGFNVDAVQNLSEAEKLSGKNKYDIIILDLLFPGKDALSTIRLIRYDNSLNSKTPILALTNLDAGEITDKAIKYGANECLFKAAQTPKTIFEAAVKLGNGLSNEEGKTG